MGSCNQAEMERIEKARLDRHAKKKVKYEPKAVFLPGEVIYLTLETQLRSTELCFQKHLRARK